MKRSIVFIYLLLIATLVLAWSIEGFSQSNDRIIKATVNVKKIVALKTQRSLSEQIDDIHSMPEHEHPKSHKPATDRVFYPREYKELQASQGTGMPSPAPLVGFASKSFDGYYPPDPHGAVSENYVVGTVNNELYIQERNGDLIADVKLKDFWAPVHQTIQLFDPRLTYDPFEHIWMLVTAASPFGDSSSLLIAVSQSEDPTGSWNLYKIKADSTGNLWADYPNIAFNKKWIAVTVNLFGDTSDNSDTGRVYIFNKRELMNGQAPSLKTFNIDQGVIPAVTYDSSMNDLYLLEVYSEAAGQLQMLKISGAVGSETITSVGYPSIHIPWSPIPAHDADFAPQLGDTALIQCNDDRMGTVIVKNNKIWCTHTVFLPADTHPERSSVMWWAMDTTGFVLQHGLIDDATGNTFYAFPSIAVNKFSDALICYSVFSGQQYASAGYSYHDHAQAAGSVNDSYVFKSGENTYNRSGGGRNRWGDCSVAVTDPLNDIDFWAISEYAESTANNWGTWWTNVSGWDTIDHDPASVEIAPNPNKGTFNIYINGQVKTSIDIDIYDLLGQHLYNTISDNKVIFISINTLKGNLAEGIYIVRVKVNGQIIDKKIVVRD